VPSTKEIILKTLCTVVLSLALVVPVAQAQVVIEERVSGGSLDLIWTPGFFLTNDLEPVTLAPGDPGYPNPSGDDTVASLTNTPPEEGGLGIAVTDPAGVANYRWEGMVWMGNGDTRRGLVARAGTPAAGFTENYQFVIQPGLLTLSLRKLSGEGAETLAEWFTTDTQSGFPPQNSWQKMAIECLGNTLRVFWNDEELTTTPIENAELPTGYVGVYNFRFDLGGVSVLYDDLVLTAIDVVDTEERSFGDLKSLYNR